MLNYFGIYKLKLQSLFLLKNNKIKYKYTKLF